LAGGASSASGPQRLGAYQLVTLLATGGMAEIFVAKTAGVSGFEKQVALKVIHPNFSSDPEFVRMLIDEAKLAVQLQHANIVQTYDLGVVEGRYYIAMELVDGADLYKVLRTASERGRDFPLDVAAFITSEVATGLDYAHRKNDPIGRPLQIVHRDVSPQNVLVSREGEVKIVDFGIAKAALRGQQTQAGVIKGKYFYMSPEQAWGDSVDARTDVFSTGILLHEMLVGEMLYLEEDLDRLLKLVRAADVEPPSRKRPSVPPELDAIVMKALAKKPQDRYANAADLATALTRFMRSAYPDFGRGRAARFVREVLEAEPSRAQITLPTLPPATRDDLGDENSLLFDLKQGRRVPAKDAHRPIEPRSPDEATRGSPALRSHANDYEDTGATEVDPRALLAIDSTELELPRISPLSSGRGFSAEDDAEKTELAHGLGPPPPSPPQNGFDTDDEESTHHRPAFPRPGAPVAGGLPPPPRRRPPSPPPAIAPSFRTATGQAIGELPTETQPPISPRRADEPQLGEPPSLVATPLPGATPLVDWSATPTVTPETSHPYLSSDPHLRLSSIRRIAELKHGKLFLLAGLFLFAALVVLAVALYGAHRRYLAVQGDAHAHLRRGSAAASSRRRVAARLRHVGVGGEVRHGRARAPAASGSRSGRRNADGRHGATRRGNDRERSYQRGHADQRRRPAAERRRDPRAASPRLQSSDENPRLEWKARDYGEGAPRKSALIGDTVSHHASPRPYAPVAR
jgi:serine/threonine-protein kinase